MLIFVILTLMATGLDMKYINNENLEMIFNKIIRVLYVIGTRYDIRFLVGLYSFLQSRKENKIFKSIQGYVETEELEVSAEFASDTNVNIWVLWLQGYDHAPTLVQSCIDSILFNSGEYNVVLLDKSNLNDYVHLPSFIWDKYNSGIISNTHFSDIVRSFLLYTYGGFWIDATVFVTKTIWSGEGVFYTLKDTKRSMSVSNGQWTGYYMYSVPKGIIPQILYKSFLNYWSHENQLIDYFLIDYIIKLAYKKNYNVKMVIENNPNNGVHRFDLSNMLNDPISSSSRGQLDIGIGVYKLSYKKVYYKKNAGKPTYYSLVIDGSLRQFLKENN